MKKLMCLSMAALLLFAAACKKDNPEKDTPGGKTEETVDYDSMGHTGVAHSVNGNVEQRIDGLDYSFYQLGIGGLYSMDYYDNGTFSAQWTNVQNYFIEMGFSYEKAVDPGDKNYIADYKYTKNGHAQYGYIGVHGWTESPLTEFYIVDDWWAKPNPDYLGTKFGEISVDDATYDIYAFLRMNEPSPNGNDTFVQLLSVRRSSRQYGRIHISSHFAKWNKLFTGQEVTLPGSKGEQKVSIRFGLPTDVKIFCEAGGNASGTIDYSYFKMTE